MAIKGKGRARRRTVTSGPKPVYVPVRKPLLQRRSFQIGAAVVVGAGILATVVIGLLIQRANDRREDRRRTEREILTRFGGAVQRSLFGAVETFQTSVIPFPDLTRDLNRMKTGDLDPKEAVVNANAIVKLAGDATTSISGIPTSRLIEGHPDLLELSQAQTLLGNAFRLFGEVGDMMKLAARQEDRKVRDALIDQGQELYGQAATMFQQGYQGYVNVRFDYGLEPPIVPPPDTPPPSPSPSATKGGDQGDEGGKGTPAPKATATASPG
jgi:hypothetical protein